MGCHEKCGIQTHFSSGRSSKFRVLAWLWDTVPRVDFMVILCPLLLLWCVIFLSFAQFVVVSGFLSRKIFHMYLEIHCVHGKRWVQDISMSPSWTRIVYKALLRLIKEIQVREKRISYSEPELNIGKMSNLCNLINKYTIPKNPNRFVSFWNLTSCF